MKLTHRTKLKSTLSLLAILLLPITLQAQTSQPPQINNAPINIDANNQQIDIQKNTITFTGDVVIIQDGLQVKADKVVINNFESNTEQVITAYGSPVYVDKNDPKNPAQNIKGTAKEIIYNVKKNSVTFIGKVVLIQKDNRIEGDKIIYNINQQTISAESNKNNRVKTVIIPNQVKEITK